LTLNQKRGGERRKRTREVEEREKKRRRRKRRRGEGEGKGEREERRYRADLGCLLPLLLGTVQLLFSKLRCLLDRCQPLTTSLTRGSGEKEKTKRE